MGVSKGMDWLVMMGWPGRMGWKEWISLGRIGEGGLAGDMGSPGVKA